MIWKDMIRRVEVAKCGCEIANIKTRRIPLGIYILSMQDQRALPRLPVDDVSGMFSAGTVSNASSDYRSLAVCPFTLAGAKLFGALYGPKGSPLWACAAAEGIFRCR
jgi:hypothetical protein